MTRREAFITVKKILSPYCGDAAAEETRYLLEFLCTCDRTALLLHGEETLTPQQSDRLLNAAYRRAEGYPLQYITGYAQFLGIPLQVGEGVLIPRSDTEFAVVKAIELLKSCTHPVIADLCSGTGCIALALEQEIAGAECYAVEWEEKAYSYLQRNLQSLGSRVHPIRADVTQSESAALLPACDLIISNPPYIRESEKSLMGKDVLNYEPASALFAKENGLYFYRKILENFLPILKPGGSIVFEIGFSEGQELQRMLAACGLKEIQIGQDFSGNDRVASARKDIERTAE